MIVSVVGVAIYDIVAVYVFGEQTPISNFIHRFVPGAPMIALAVGAWVRHMFGSFPKPAQPLQSAAPGAFRRLLGFLSKIRIHSPVSASSKPTLPSGRGVPLGSNSGGGSMTTANPTITAKATAVSQATGITGITSIIAVIEQLFQAFTLCATPTAASVHSMISNPTRPQERALDRIVRRNFRRNPAAQQIVLDGIMQVGSTSTVAETSAMWSEANPGHPPLV
jgi:hypothetical protein